VWLDYPPGEAGVCPECKARVALYDRREERELFREFWASGGKREARALFKSWYYGATHSGLEPVVKVAKMLKEHKEEVLRWFRKLCFRSII